MKNSSLKIAAFVAFVILAANSLAQDVIITNDAKKIDAKIFEVSKTEIRYKEKDNLDGPTFVLEINEISSIIYSNGKVVVYNQTTSTESAQEEHSTEQQPDESEYIADILLLSGDTITAQIAELESNYVAYIENGKSYTLPASQIEKVTFLRNGQFKVYNRTQNIVASQPNVNEENSPDNNKNVTTTSKSGRIYRDDGHYLHNETYISSKEVERILQRENNAAYIQWKKADGMLIGSAVCLGIGGGLALGGLFPLINNHYVTSLVMEGSAIVPLCISLGLALGASAQYNKAIDIYNSEYNQAAVQFKWHVAPSEVGLAIAF